MTLKGKVTARTCPYCGHHEIGIVTDNGTFFPLRPGLVVEIIQPDANGVPSSTTKSQGFSPQFADDMRAFEIWFPEPIKGFHRLIQKYGVFLPKGHQSAPMTPQSYEWAYREKIRILIEKEVSTPLPVILDRFFTAPHLASGDSKDVVKAMWEELEEVREPVRLVTAWLEDPSPNNTAKLLVPFSETDKNTEGNETEETIKELLASLSLEAFLELLR